MAAHPFQHHHRGGSLGGTRKPLLRFAVGLCLLVLAGATGNDGLAGSASPPATQASQPASRRFGRGVIIPITDEINDVTTKSLKRRIDLARNNGAELVIFEMDTPGGMVSSAIAICDLIKSMPEHTAAWVHPDAFSAGAMISLACDEILVAKRSTLGDCQPIMIGPEGPTKVPKGIEAKLTSPLLEEFRDSAQRHGYDWLMCEAMIRPEIEVFWVENRKTGERRFVTREQRDRLFGLTTTRPGPTTQTQPVQQDNPPSYTEWQYVTSHPLLREIKQPIVAAHELLTMTQNEALAFGFAKAMIADETELKDYYGLASLPKRIEYTWSEYLVAWLTSPAVRSILLIVMLLAAYTELNTPGVGLPGLVALICLAIFLGAPYLTGLADMWDLLFIAAGIGLLLVEIFVLPGFGVAGILGITLLMVGILASFVPTEWPDQGPLHLPTMEYTWTALKRGLLAVAAALVTSLAGMVALSRYFQQVPYVGKMVQPNPRAEDVSIDDWFADLPKPGETGTAAGPLRPAGKARFGEKLVDVVAEAEFIDPGQEVLVTERRGNRVVVRKAPQGNRQESS